MTLDQPPSSSSSSSHASAHYQQKYKYAQQHVQQHAQQRQHAQQPRYPRRRSLPPQLVDSALAMSSMAASSSTSSSSSSSYRRMSSSLDPLWEETSSSTLSSSVVHGANGTSTSIPQQTSVHQASAHRAYGRPPLSTRQSLPMDVGAYQQHNHGQSMDVGNYQQLQQHQQQHMVMMNAQQYQQQQQQHAVYAQAQYAQAQYASQHASLFAPQHASQQHAATWAHRRASDTDMYGSAGYKNDLGTTDDGLAGYSMQVQQQQVLQLQQQQSQPLQHHALRRQSNASSIGGLPSVPMTSIPAPRMQHVNEVDHDNDDYHWERLALNSASSLPAPVPHISSTFQPPLHFPPDVGGISSCKVQQGAFADGGSEFDERGWDGRVIAGDAPAARRRSSVVEVAPRRAGTYNPTTAGHRASMPVGSLDHDQHSVTRHHIHPSRPMPLPLPRFPPSSAATNNHHYHHRHPPIVVVPQKSLFATHTSTPQTEQLIEFVSHMVFHIFWKGSEAFDGVLAAMKERCLTPVDAVGEAVSMRDGGGVGPSPVSALDPAYQATPEFVKYTKYLLETMQLSCSTALLSLYYLHRLRPRVQHMFVPGTFHHQHSPKHAVDADGGQPQPQQRYQYRRDPKLEYRLFTISVILSNKYLDDNSYSNKAWSDVTGLELRKINIMEQEFMKYIDYGLSVPDDQYAAWVHWLESNIDGTLAGATTCTNPARLFALEQLCGQSTPHTPVTPIMFAASAGRQHAMAMMKGRRASLPATPLPPRPPMAVSGKGVEGDVEVNARNRPPSRQYLPTPNSSRRPPADRTEPTTHPRYMSRRNSGAGNAPSTTRPPSRADHYSSSDGTGATMDWQQGHDVSAATIYVHTAGQQPHCNEDTGFHTASSASPSDESPVVHLQRYRTRSQTALAAAHAQALARQRYAAAELPGAYGNMNLGSGGGGGAYR